VLFFDRSLDDKIKDAQFALKQAKRRHMPWLCKSTDADVPVEDAESDLRRVGSVHTMDSLKNLLRPSTSASSPSSSRPGSFKGSLTGSPPSSRPGSFKGLPPNLSPPSPSSDQQMGSGFKPKLQKATSFHGLSNSSAASPSSEEQMGSRYKQMLKKSVSFNGSNKPAELTVTR